MTYESGAFLSDINVWFFEGWRIMLTFFVVESTMAMLFNSMDRTASFQCSHRILANELICSAYFRRFYGYATTKCSEKVEN